MDFENDEDILKEINKRGGDNDLDDELAALEAEMNGGAKKPKKKKKPGDELSLSDLSDEEEEKPAQKERKQSDDDLAALEKEGLDDIEDEDEKPVQKQPPPKAQPKPQPKPQPKAQQVPQNKPQINKEELAKAMQKKQQASQAQPPKPNKEELAKAMQKKSSGAGGEDLYPEIAENKYHAVAKMTSLTVLEKEKELCDTIIDYKKKRNEDFDTWDFKKTSIDDRIGIITSTVQDGLWDLPMYQKKVKEQYQWEQKLLIFVEKDPKLSAKQKQVIRDRCNNRKKVIEEELTRNLDEEGGEGEPKKEEPKKQETKKEEPKKVEKPQPDATKPAAEKSKVTAAPGAKVDFYPDGVENKYHNVAKMDSIGVLQSELEICDLIIGYKKKKNEDYDTWEFKKETIQTRMETIQSAVEEGILDVEGYRKKIKAEYQYESKLLQFVEKDPKINEAQKKIIIERVNKRKKKIEEELTQNVDEEGDGGAEEEPQEKPTAKKSKKDELSVKKSLNPMYAVDKKDEGKEIERLTQVVTDRLNEYRAAIDYFKTNELTEQQTNAIKSAKAICIELKKIQDGKWREVNEFKLPDPVTPEYIYGYTKEERAQKFKKIMQEYNNQRKAVQEDINNRVGALKRLSKVQLKKVEGTAKKDLEGLKAKKEKYEKIIKLLGEKFQDKWVPAPLFIETTEEKKVEKINADIGENTVRIIFGKTTYSKNDRLYLIVTFPEKNFSETFNQKGAGNWSHQFDWKLDKSDFRSFFKNKIHVDIWEKKTLFKDKHRGEFDIEPRGLKDNIECTGQYPIKLESEREGTSAEVTVKVRTPCKEQLFEVIEKPVFQVTRIYPPFNLRGQNNTEAVKLDVSQTNVTSDDLKVHNKPSGNPAPSPSPATNTKKQMPKPTQQTPAAKQKAGGAPKKQTGPKEHIDKSEFNEAELNDPDDINCLNTLMVLEFKINKYQEVSNKIDGRTPRALMQRIVKMKCKKQSITDSLGDDISPEDYLVLLKTTFAHDKKLVDYFNQEKDAEKSKLVSERLPLIVKETEELMKQMPKK